MYSEIYNQFTSANPITMTMKEFYTDSDGFLNENAFRSFVKQLTAEDKYFLICLKIDISVSNERRGYAFGNRLLRKIYLQIKDRFCIFRVNGDKFNLLVPERELRNVKALLNSSSEHSDMFSIFYGLAYNTFVTGDNFMELRRYAKDLMYSDKALRTNRLVNDVRDDTIVGNKENTPLDLRETETHKYIETMWYGIITFIETQPIKRTITAYIFPTEFKEKLASVNMIAVIDDLIDYRLYTGNSINFGFDGMKFTMNARFDAEGHLSIVCFKNRNDRGECDIKVKIHEGSCIPASFGKRAGKGREIYPIKSNRYGTCDYVLWNDETKKCVIDKTGIVEIDGENYAVYADTDSIDLVLQ